MLRRSLAGFVLALCALAGCQDYTFNPVGKCVIQPGSTRITLSSETAADILFVVDDSRSMEAEQARLVSNFKSFIDTLATIEQERVADGLDPFDFHIAITSSSIFESYVSDAGVTCSSEGSNVYGCAFSSSQSRYSTASDNSCTSSEVGDTCSDMSHTYRSFDSTCTAGLSTEGDSYPSGNFMAASGNPYVLHFTKDLDWDAGSSNSAIQALITQFQENIAVGTCGSGMEQGLQAGRMAVEKALGDAGVSQVSGLDAGEWPHDNAKMVVVWVGDEDDCSSPDDPTRALSFYSGATTTGADVCVFEQEKAVSSQKFYTISELANYFTNLGRTFAAAFVYSAVTDSCTTDSTTGDVICTPGTCTCEIPTSCTSYSTTDAGYGECYVPSSCSGKISYISYTDDAGTTVDVGSRFSQMSAALRDAGSTTYEASVCAADWSDTLSAIANMVKPVDTLTLPTIPATSDVVVLRIEDSSGNTVKWCTGPGTSLGWYFVNCSTAVATSSSGTVVSKCIAINHTTATCEASAGQTYIAQYLGRVPESGCTETYTTDGGAQSCATALGGSASDWKCYGGNADAGVNGTCVCSTQ